MCQTQGVLMHERDVLTFVCVFAGLQPVNVRAAAKARRLHRRLRIISGSAAGVRHCVLQNTRLAAC